MNITQIRNATQHITFGGKTFLIDPMLAAKGTYPGFAGTARAEIRNPTVDLPVDIDTLLNVDALIVTHLHEDHWDEAAARVVPKDKPIYVQNDRDAQVLREQGFTQLTVLTQNTALGDITLRKTDGQHGSDRAYAIPQMAERLGDACGVIFQHQAEKTLYLVGDTVWRDEVETNMRTFQPGVVIVNAGFAHVIGFGPIIMGAEDVLKTHFTLPEAQIVATHMEAINHCLLTRAALKEYTCDNQIAQFVNVPEDGETLTF
ncbi:MBL fold metallo-hydrolase [Citrobacter portucalensis]|uniref:MBL fold metallo-hydrolase n=1 Tax=Citrobacter TaxID=544 RepID=UPI000F7115E9|nr:MULTISPECIES: MBL fold metallo-hydrolase [Citrobacter]MBJ9845530.1 MBL fold metallo-hydrolase [Citrobacter freundii]NUE70921.1 MBL fold metallo-hydrolase [Escherichia coli]MBI1677054.1 MBL fold metallo-hydrolase [Citrobacter portucalensis]MDM2880498.1 MBL fold metallo-hydrolase [Citrobacter sp. Cpo044]MDQ2228319.1 MBL fold metallo-hydrolase [Citrobacter portucalensis]